MKIFKRLLLALFIVFAAISSASSATATIYPTGDSSTDSWVVTSLWSKIDETTLNEADYIALAATSSQNVSSSCAFNWGDLPANVGAISDVRFFVQAKYTITGSGTATFKLDIPDSGHQTTVSLTSSSALYHAHYSTNPHTGSAWSKSEIDNGTFGLYGNVAADANKGDNVAITVYWSYIEVDYTETSSFTPQVIIIQ